MEYINEPSKNIPVSHECDVLVCGGGIAGIAAALASARKGAKVYKSALTAQLQRML